MSDDARLLAVDLGLRCGWATFDAEGRLLAYGSRHFGNRTALRKAIPRILGEHPGLEALVIEGGGDLFIPWEKEAARRGIPVTQVMGEEWRRQTLLPRQRTSGRDAKDAADGLARDVIERSGAKRPTSLRHDAAEAILVGTWFTSRRSPRDGRSPGDTAGPR
jgi:hypothetical protein